MSDDPYDWIVNTPLMRLEADQQRARNIQAELNEPTWEERERQAEQQRRAEIIRQANLPRLQREHLHRVRSIAGSKGAAVRWANHKLKRPPAPLVEDADCPVPEIAAGLAGAALAIFGICMGGKR